MTTQDEAYPLIFNQKQMRVIDRIVILRVRGNLKEADRLQRMLLNDHYASVRGIQATVEKTEQQRVYGEALSKAIEKGTLL